MDWSDERWVKLYVRSTVAWQVASFNARGLYYELMRMAGKDSDRVKLGRLGADGLARVVGLGVTECNAALRELTEGGWIAVDGENTENVYLVGHLEQQKSQTSNKLRQAEYRARHRGNDLAISDDVTERNAALRDVTESNDKKRREEKREEERESRARPPRKALEATSAAHDLAMYFFEAIRSHSPTFEPEATLPAWALEFDVGLRNGQTAEMFREAIDFAHRDSDPFWRGNVLSVKKLRKKLQELLVKARQRKKPNGQPRQVSLEDAGYIDADEYDRRQRALRGAP